MFLEHRRFVMTAAQPLSPGQIVRVRSRQYLVEGVVPPLDATDATLVRLSCLEDDAQGDPLEVLWEKEIDARTIDGTDWQAVASRGFDAPRLFSAYLHTLRWNCVTSTNARLFQAPYRAGIEVKAYQLEPLRKALLMPRVNLFIADDVGLGKTIEAGLILREMLMRQKVRRTVICVPPSVVRQWRDEMEQRFGLKVMARQAEGAEATAEVSSNRLGWNLEREDLEREAQGPQYSRPQGDTLRRHGPPRPGMGVPDDPCRSRPARREPPAPLPRSACRRVLL